MDTNDILNKFITSMLNVDIQDIESFTIEYSGRCEPIVPPHRAILPLFRATSN